jgi:cyclic beta-1,2-glucan synthetase
MNPPILLGQDLSAEGHAFASRQAILVQHASGKQFREQTLLAVGSAFALARYTDEQVRAKQSSPTEEKTPGIQRMEGATRLLRSSAIEIQSALPILGKLPFARSVTGVEAPRILGVAEAFLNAAKFQWSLSGLSSFLKGFQAEEPLSLKELWTFPVALKLALLEEILTQAAGAFSKLPASDAALNASLLCLHEVSLPVWANILEPLVPFEDILRQDPANTYSHMDFESRDMYRLAVAKVAKRSPLNEVEVANMALTLARDSSQQPSVNERITKRTSHIGFYLIDDGLNELRKRCHFHPRILDRVRIILKTYPDDFYIGGIQTIALLVMGAIILPLVPLYNPLGSLAFAFLLLLLPVSQGAVELMNHTISAIL